MFGDCRTVIVRESLNSQARSKTLCGRAETRRQGGRCERFGRAGQHHRRGYTGNPWRRIRLWGVDAPESSQLCRGDESLQYRCGAKAANDLDAFIAGWPVNCLPISLDRYGRTVATCSVGGTDLGDWLVRNGLALDWPEYSKRKYDAAQRDAEHAGRGIWTGSYVEPWLYRVLYSGERKPRQLLG